MSESGQKKVHDRLFTSFFFSFFLFSSFSRHLCILESLRKCLKAKKTKTKTKTKNRMTGLSPSADSGILGEFCLKVDKRNSFTGLSRLFHTICVLLASLLLEGIGVGNFGEGVLATLRESGVLGEMSEGGQQKLRCQSFSTGESCHKYPFLSGQNFCLGKHVFCFVLFVATEHVFCLD